MADWHLAELSQALSQAGWTIISQMPGDERKVSATWAIQRSTHHAPLLIDFNGLAEERCLPLTEAYGCAVRGITGHSLYFGRSSGQYTCDLGGFIGALSQLEIEWWKPR